MIESHVSTEKHSRGLAYSANVHNGFNHVPYFTEAPGKTVYQLLFRVSLVIIVIKHNPLHSYRSALWVECPGRCNELFDVSVLFEHQKLVCIIHCTPIFLILP